MVVLLNFLFVFCNKQNTQNTLTGSVALCIRSERRFVFQVTPSRFRIVNVVAVVDDDLRTQFFVVASVVVETVNNHRSGIAS